ncbi:MAG: NAD-dependent epimerase/dehydratase family protein [Pseudomonadota bacterium]
MPGSRPTVAITGATGFIGRAVVRAFAANGAWDVRALVRQDAPDLTGEVTAAGFNLSAGHAAVSSHVVGDLREPSDLPRALTGVDVLVHAAARAHVLSNTAGDPDAAFHAANVQASVSLAEAARAVGVRRLIFLSSIGVHGDATARDTAITEQSPFSPLTAYTRSKLAAERALEALANETGIELIVLRLPLVYGASDRANGSDVPGNLARLIAAVARGVPLPVAAIDNRRTLLDRAHLADAVVRCAEAREGHPITNRAFVIADAEDVSTPGLVRAIGEGLGRPSRSWPLSPTLLRTGLAFVGRAAIARQLTGSLRVDPSAFVAAVDWKPQRAPLAAIAAATATCRKG